MIRKLFKKIKHHEKINAFIARNKIPQKYLSINRRSVAKGVFIGIFIAFIPMPLQMVAVVALTPFMHFNVPIAILMVWFSNPLTMPFMYYMEYQTGNFLLGKPPLPDIELSIRWFTDNWDNIILPLYVGTIPYSMIISTVAYLAINWCWINSVKKQKKDKSKS